MRPFLAFVALISFVASFGTRANAQMPMPFVQLQATLASVARSSHARVAMQIQDLATGLTSGVNVNAVMPAASTIKVPIMVEVFRQMEAGNFDLNRRVELMASDRDWGSGDIAASPIGSTFPVSTLLEQMITVSDNTAANMLIRLVGRQHINHTMTGLGLRHTHLADYIRTEEWSVRSTLRTTPADMVKLLADMARNQLIDEWSSKQMIAILEHQEINTLLPVPLPDIPIAHKTGSFNDTLNDVGIVFAGEPYVIAVMTTDLPSLGTGRSIIHRISRVAYTRIQQFAKWRTANEPQPVDAVNEAPPQQQSDDGTTQDVPMWATPAPSPAASPAI